MQSIKCIKIYLLPKFCWRVAEAKTVATLITAVSVDDIS